MHLLQGHTVTVWDVALSRDRRLLASGGNDGTVKLRDLMNGQPRITLRGNAGGVHSVALSGNGAQVVSGGLEAAVRVWDASTGHVISTLLGHSGALLDVAVSRNRRLVASASDNGTVTIWDAHSGKCPRQLSNDRLYQRRDITGLIGTTDAQRAVLLAMAPFESSC